VEVFPSKRSYNTKAIKRKEREKKRKLTSGIKGEKGEEK